MPAPGFSGGSVQFTAGEKTESQTSSFLMRKTYREGTAAILLECQNCRRTDKSHWTPPLGCPTLSGQGYFNSLPPDELTQSISHPIHSGSWCLSWSLSDYRPIQARSGCLQEAEKVRCHFVPESEDFDNAFWKTLRPIEFLIDKHSSYECQSFPLKTHIWRIKTLHPNTSVEHVSFCPCLVPIALHPPWLGLSVFYLGNFIDLFFIVHLSR